MTYYLECVLCKKQYNGNEIRYRCDCGEVLEVKRSDFESVKKSVTQKLFDKRWKSTQFPYQSGVWRYKELILDIPHLAIISKPEGNTNLYRVDKGERNGYARLADFTGLDEFYLKHEGENPTGSFKDRGMTVGISFAKHLGVKAVACASTGNTSSSLASYAAVAGIPCFVFIPKGKISPSKLAQSVAYGATHIEIDGDFDVAMSMVERICNQFRIYLLNSINPLRLEGQKTIAFEILQQLNWRIPDWIVLPGGNLGNTSALGKGLEELREVGIIKKLPRFAVIQAHGANPFYKSYRENFKRKFSIHAETLATAIKIGNPVSFLRAKRVIIETNGVVEEVTDREIMQSKNSIDASGIGCEIASAATVAGIKKLVKENVIKKGDSVVGILTGHILKDPISVVPHKGRIMRNVRINRLSQFFSDFLSG